jgi:hypothetical protein
MTEKNEPTVNLMIVDRNRIGIDLHADRQTIER